MIEWLKTWTNQIIVAVVIAVIFNLIIPNGKNKKYIKMIINLYILFILINPIISNFTSGDELNLSNYKDYFENYNSIETSSSLNSNELIENTVKKNIKENIKKKLELQGYNVTSISIDINNSEGNKYGQIKNIKLKVIKEKNTKDENTVYSDNQNFSVQINTVEEVNIGSEKKETRVELRKSEIKEIKKLISEEYDISENCIEVN